MAAKRKPKKKPAALVNDPNTLRFIPDDGASDETSLALMAYDPAVRSLAGARLFIKGLTGPQALTESLESLNAQINEVQAGSLRGVEKTLVAQANTLDAIFNELARRASCYMDQHMGQTETFLRLALKAQSQCRTTLETLAEIKNPMAGAYVRQANITAGHQQVNNGTSQAGEASRTREIENPPNKLLEQNYGKRLDIGTPGTAGAFDPQVETVGAIDRAKVGRGQGKGIEK